jgi:hypothetical protein
MLALLFGRFGLLGLAARLSSSLRLCFSRAILFLGAQATLL